MPRRIILLAMFCAIACSTWATDKYTIKIEPLKGEKWWGVFVGDAPKEPFLQPFSVNTAENSHSCSLVPMLISSAGRYLCSDYPIEVCFDGKSFTVSSEVEKPEVKRGGRTLREAYLVCYHRNFNKEAPQERNIPAELLSNLIYETEIEIGCMQSQQKILDYADRIIKEGLPTGYIVIADGWRTASGTYEFDRELYPYPETLVEKLHEAGFKVMLTVTPYLPASGRAFVGNRMQNRLLTDDSGAPVLVNTRNGIQSILDISKPECRESLKRQLEELKSAYGIDALRFDCGEMMFSDDISVKTDSFAEAWKNTGQALGGTLEFIPGLGTDGNPYVSSTKTDAPSLRKMLSDAINSSLAFGSGTYMSAMQWEPSSQDELLRAIQIATMLPSPHIPCAPWRISDTNLYAQLKNTLTMRASMSDYMSQTAQQASRTAEPVLRHMEYQFPRCGFADCDNQFMLGAKYLVAPVLDEKPSRMVRLPRGIWQDSAGKRYKGPVVINADSQDGRMICFELQTK